MACSKPSTRNILLLLVILPSWTSFLIRRLCRMGILKSGSVLNNFLLWLGVIDQPLTILRIPIWPFYTRHCLRLRAVYGTADLCRVGRVEFRGERCFDLNFEREKRSLYHDRF